MLELGSIHPDEPSARRAVAMLLSAGIEANRVKVIRPRAARSDAVRAEPPDDRGSWKSRLGVAAAGGTYGAALSGLVCVTLTVMQAAFVLAQPVVAYFSMVGTAAAAGAVAALAGQRSTPEAVPRTRRCGRGWAVVVHVRDADQRALAARALARARGTAAA